MHARILSKFACAMMALTTAATISGTTFASPLRIDFEGQISSAGSFEDPTGNFNPGDALAGYWLVDPATPDGDASSTRGEYLQSGSPVFEMNINGHTFTSDNTTVQILDDHTLGIGTIDAYDVLGESPSSTVPGLQVNQTQITLRDTQLPLDALTSDSLPTGAPDPANFDQVGQAAGQITGNVNGQPFFMNLEILRTTAVPEPTTCSLLALSSGVLLLKRSR